METDQPPLAPQAPPIPTQAARGMLLICRHQFQSYGDQHMAKAPPQATKAAVNYALVASINETLLLL